MFEQIIKDPRVRQEIEAAGFKAWPGWAGAKLRSDGYAKATVLFYEQAAAHFAFLADRETGPAISSS